MSSRRLVCVTATALAGMVPGLFAADAPAAKGRVPVTLSTQLANDGWMIIVNLADDDVREVACRLDGEGDFRSLGLTPTVNPKTGYPIPVTFFNLPPGAGEKDEHVVSVKWTTGGGKTRGPYDLSVSLAGEVVKNAKYILETVTSNSWVAFGTDYKGKPILFFTHLLSHRNALREIRYSFDDKTVSRTFAFTPWKDLGDTPTVGDDPIYVDVPADTKFAAVQLRYLDDTESEIKTFPVRRSTTP